jgi:hypothetical protein
VKRVLNFGKLLGRPNSMKSVFEGLSEGRFAEIQEETSANVFPRKETLSRNFVEEKERKS